MANTRLTVMRTIRFIIEAMEYERAGIRPKRWNAKSVWMKCDNESRMIRTTTNKNSEEASISVFVAVIRSINRPDSLNRNTTDRQTKPMLEQ
ncbi:hypothetical protein QA089_003647 [Meyerozyma guilliermondii]